MKRRDFLKELRAKNLSELRKLAQETKKELVKLRMEKMMAKLAKPHLLRSTKKKLARILTVIKEKERNK